MICSDEAIVLKTRDFRETSKIAIFYSLKYGKISGLLKGVRSDPKKFGSRLDFLSVNNIVFYKKRFSELHLVSQCDLKKYFGSLNKDLVKFGLGSFCSELIDSIMPSEEPHQEIYWLFLNFLNSLEESTSPKKLIYSFTLKALSLSGFQPHLESCVICNKAVKKHAFFSNHFGGLLCDRCSMRDDQRENILAGTVSTILFLQNTAWRDSLRLNMLPDINRQLNRVIFSFLNFNLEKKFKSLEVLDELLGERVAH